ncbi:MAG TPA: luciferase family protein [Gaiellaceae bacterium]|nr:luciferase family protein [Gaiellaceae bacterium]
MDARDAIRAAVLSWDGVNEHPHRFGGVEFRLGKRELGHLHGGRLADLPFPRTVRNMLVETGRALPHRVLPESGWVSRPIRDEDDVAEVIELFRLSYERARLAATAAARRSPSAAARRSG